MSRILTISLLIIIAVALSGCTSTDPSNAGPAVVQKYDRANTNLDAKIVDVKFDRNDARAGEIVNAELFIANTGTEKITSETVEIKARLKTLDDSLANLYLKTMSDEKKTRMIDPLNFETDIEPGIVKSISAEFHTVKEMEGRSLAGTYEITITVSVNGQKAETMLVPLRLYPGEVREITPTVTPAVALAPSITPRPASTAVSIPVPTETIAVIETSTVTPKPVIVATPTGKVRSTRIRSDRFTEALITINAGDAIMWDNYDETSPRYTIVEKNGKIPEIILPGAKKASQIFNSTGEYKFSLIFQGMGGREPSVQTISVKVNASQ